MGFELEGLIGERAAFRGAKTRVPDAVACRLTGDLVLVPLTGPLLGAVARHYGIGNAAGAPDGVAKAWAAEISATDPVVHVSAYEFGDDGHETYTLWHQGQPRWTSGRESEVRRYFREERHVDAGPGFDIGKYRGESAAERWVESRAPLDDLEE